jgi:hypothetical protein
MALDNSPILRWGRPCAAFTFRRTASVRFWVIAHWAPTKVIPTPILHQVFIWAYFRSRGNRCENCEKWSQFWTWVAATSQTSQHLNTSLPR